jgi:uncharacterized Zn finger protein (UPF0148 family)
LRCPNCGFENQEGRRFCTECGEKIAQVEAKRARARRKSQREAALYRREAEKEGLDDEEAERRRRRSRRRTRPWMGIVLAAILVIAAVVIIIVLSSGGKSGPEKAVETFYEAIAKKDMMTYLKHTEPQLYKMAQNGEYELDPNLEGLTYDSYRLEGLVTRLVKEEGDYAEVELIAGYYEGIYSDGSGSGGVDFSQYPRLVILDRIEGVWIIREYGSMKLPYPLPEVMDEEPEFPEVEEPS